MKAAKSKNAVKQFHQNVINWYEQFGRKGLPWRNTKDPYKIYLSEIMLQQTQVKTVLERFYTPFLDRFPTLKSLAAADLDAVLHQWQGLGYYSRARNLHKAAIATQGALPSNIDDLIALPGIGKNTAHAIAAFAFHQPVPIMEANLKRVLSRIYAQETANDAQLWELAHALVDTDHPFIYNQAMMDIGATLCTKTDPNCDHCPANHICAGKESPSAYPAAKKKKTIPTRNKHIVVLHNKKKQLLATPRDTQFLHGLYHFDERTAKPDNAKEIGHVIQKYSHFTLDAQIWLKPSNTHSNHWYSFEKLKELPMSNAEKKIIVLLDAVFC